MSAFTIILCVLVADFLTGLVHWWEDAYADPRWPWPWGLLVAQPNTSTRPGSPSRASGSGTT